MLRRPLAILAVSWLAIVLVPAGADAAELTLSPRSQSARSGQLVKLHATAPHAGACRLHVDAQRLRVRAMGPGTRFVVSARVSRRARPGAHSLSLRCATQRMRTRVVVARSTRNRHASGGLFRGRLHISAVKPSSALQPAPGSSATELSWGSAPFPRSIVSASAEAQQWWASHAAGIVGPFRNGQCTDWAQLRRPDIVQAVYMRTYDRSGPDSVVSSWDARYWPELAAQAGLPVGRRPVVGAIMVFAPGSYGAGSAGHVAVVESVAANGSFVVTAMNAPIVGTVTPQPYDAQSAAAFATDPGIAFIL